MTYSLRKRILPYLLILAFVVAKAPRLNYPFYWDESWVYAPAIYAMHDHGPSLMPNAISVEYSRGHPLLFQAGCALWMDIFGKSHIAMHAYALLLSVLLAIATYELIRKLFNPGAALLALALLLLNPDFFLYATFLLTDLPLGLAALLALYYYTAKKYVRAALAIALAAYIKESGLVLIPVLFADAALEFFRGQPERREALRKAAAIIGGCLLIFLFFAIQKLQHGWFLYPAHTGMIHTDVPHTADFIQQILKHMLVDSQMYWGGIIGSALCFAVAWQKNRPSLLLLPLSFWCIYFCTTILSYKDAAFLIVVPLGAGVMICCLKWLKPMAPQQRKFIWLSVVFALAYLYFSAINFYEPRYLFPAVLMVSIILPAICFERLVAIATDRKWISIACITLIIAASIYSLQVAIETCNIFGRMRLHQDIVDYFEERNDYNTSICARQFFEYQHLTLPNTGYLHKERRFTHVTTEIDRTTRYAIWGTIDPSEPFFNKIAGDTSFHLIQRFSEGADHIDVYKRN